MGGQKGLCKGLKVGESKERPLVLAAQTWKGLKCTDGANGVLLVLKPDGNRQSSPTVLVGVHSEQNEGVRQDHIL